MMPSAELLLTCLAVFALLLALTARPYTAFAMLLLLLVAALSASYIKQVYLGVPLTLADVWFFLLAPLQNLIVRSYEIEADAFGLNASREPYGWAMAAMRLSTYRKISPGKLEEFLFYDHPSGYECVHAAMIWQKENQVERAP